MANGHTVYQGERSVSRSPFFPKFARNSVRVTGHPWAFGIAIATILIWAVSGPIFKFSDSWQLVINTATTIITFLMVFLIQNAQNRDSEAIQLKLAELIRATRSAHNAFLDIEELSVEELDRIKDNLGKLARKAREDFRTGRSDFGCPDMKAGRGHAELFQPVFVNSRSGSVNGTTKHLIKENL